VGANRWRSRGTLIVAAALLLASPHPLLADGFVDHLARVDRALKRPSNVSQQARESCLKRRNFAVRLYSMGEVERAERGLEYCSQMLQIPEKAPTPIAQEAPVPIAEIQARAAREIERALPLKPNVANGLKIYRTCALCHTPEGWGLQSGLVPQIAGQHRKVIIKQLADIRAGNRGKRDHGPLRVRREHRRHPSDRGRCGLHRHARDECRDGERSRERPGARCPAVSEQLRSLSR
jgi:cytochrome c553